MTPGRNCRLVYPRRGHSPVGSVRNWVGESGRVRMSTLAQPRTPRSQQLLSLIGLAPTLIA